MRANIAIYSDSELRYWTVCVCCSCLIVDIFLYSYIIFLYSDIFIADTFSTHSTSTTTVRTTLCITSRSSFSTTKWKPRSASFSSVHRSFTRCISGCGTGSMGCQLCLTLVLVLMVHWPNAGSEVVRIDPLRFLAGCHKRRLDQALSVLSFSLGFF